MSWLLLFGLTALVVLLPMVPAWIEWRWPTDVTPLFIDKDDALDPPFLARSFALRLSTALALHQTHLGRSRLCSLQPGEDWPLDPRERADGTSHRVWAVQGKVDLPAGIHFLGEVASRGSLRAAAGGLYRALWVRDRLQLPGGCTVLRWAHGTQIEVGPHCDLAGRVSADEAIQLAPGVRFALLHAPVLRFGQGRPAGLSEAATLPASGTGLSGPVVWHAASGRGRCDTALVVEAGRQWSGDLVCADELSVGPGCVMQGSLKAHGTLTLGAGCVVHGSVVARGAVRLGPGCCVHGSVVSETAIVLGEGAVIGLPGRASTVAAPDIDVDAGVLVHGTVWASRAGQCRADNRPEAVAAQPAPRARSAAAAQEATA